MTDSALLQEHEVVNQTDSPSLTIRDLVGFLFGRREAVLRVADSSKALWIAAVLVFSAALAREYDGEYLMAQPWYLLVPLLFSLISSCVLFMVAYTCLYRRLEDRPKFWHEYRVFLTCFWMTAPLAWLYAVPYERFFNPYDAMVANLWTLGVVSLWRVLLITRVLAVRTGINVFGTFFVVMFFADGVAMLASLFSPSPILNVMGGIRHSPEDELLLAVKIAVVVLGFYSLLVWLIGAIVVCFKCKPNEGRPRTNASPVMRVRPSFTVLVVLSIVGWVPALIVTQPEQQRRYQADRLMAAGDISSALEFMGRRHRDDFPPHFDPRPRKWVNQNSPDLYKVMEIIAAGPQQDWVYETYLRKFEFEIVRRHYYLWPNEERATHLKSILTSLPEGSRLAYEIRDEVQITMPTSPNAESDKDYLDNLNTLLQLAQEYEAKKNGN